MTPSKEDYLKKIVELGGEHQIISNKKLVQAMGVSAASVTEMNTRLLKADLITYIPYKGVQVTPQGLRQANQLIRKHRIWESFLVEKLNFDWDEVHEEAEKLEHVSSDKLIDRLAELLGNPKYDPHGGLIPNSDGSMPASSFINLSELDCSSHFIIREVSDLPEILAYISQKQIHLGQKYYLQEYDQLNAIHVLVVPETQQLILVNQETANQIKIELVEG